MCFFGLSFSCIFEDSKHSRTNRHQSAHQSFSHRTKSVSMSIWKVDEVWPLHSQRGGGNDAARALWFAKMTDAERAKWVPAEGLSLPRFFPSQRQQRQQSHTVADILTTLTTHTFHRGVFLCRQPRFRKVQKAHLCRL